MPAGEMGARGESWAAARPDMISALNKSEQMVLALLEAGFQPGYRGLALRAG